ncbi:MAG TPA: methylated-DNA--[protein]-cysteine S-methyltransferase [Actinomycetota bacterium]|jgi:methylated-DNA-[protein]-cysteine S-methyltransferase|nr:methylated-DNA--[protein]-cysteine S-methyltransferase [Actinomycetota bacterium]
MKYTHVDTPIGKLTVVAGGTGIRRILWDGEAPPEDAVEGHSDLLDAAVTQIREYFTGNRTTFDLPLDLGGTPFQQKVWRELGSIPFGTTISYGEQARRIGRPQAARAVGAANGRNPVPVVLPCHRVIGSGGALTGFGGGLDTKRTLLRHEEEIVAGRG